MAQCDRMLGPVMDPDATFFERWGALRFVREPLQERLRTEQTLLDELNAVLSPAMHERILVQGERVRRLLNQVERLACGRCTARELAQATQELVQALRIWYAEIEFGVGNLRRGDLANETSRLLDQLSYRPVLNGANPA